ncbi:MAG: phenylacetate--CoA ligase family protein [Thermoplasmatales archaeon]|nr:MAG: phenylacetate--CoA ligase family protein [Thermoplasmatales archaeon]
MNPFLNPFFAFRVLKSYFVDVNRLWSINTSDLKKFQSKQLQRLVKYAYTVPFYHEKYKNAGVHPSDIQGINDIGKLPFISKDDIRKNFPDRIISSAADKSKMVKSYTSGTTGKPVSIYIDMYTIVLGILGYVRVIKEHKVNWRKTRMTVIADLSEHSAESEYLTDGMIPKLKPFFSLNNMQILHTYDDPKKLMKKIISFQPEFIGGYPGMLRQLALLKNRGFGEDIQPKCILSTGSVLDKFLKGYIEDSFKTQLFDTYGAMESGPMAFECRQGKYHVHSDLVYLEFVDDDGKPVSPEEPGQSVVTRLYGRGTPIIRYTGLDDIITPSEDRCTCGLTGGFISKIHGRESHSITLPNGTVVLPSTLDEFIGELYRSFNLDCIERFQIIQPRINKIEIYAVIDNELRNTFPIEKLFSEIQHSFQEKFGSDIEVNVKEIDKIKPHTAGVISKVDRGKIKKKKYI